MSDAMEGKKPPTDAHAPAGDKPLPEETGGRQRREDWARARTEETVVRAIKGVIEEMRLLLAQRGK